MSSEYLYTKDKAPLTVNYNNNFTINNYFNVPFPEQKRQTFFKSNFSEAQMPKTFAKTTSQLKIEEKPKLLPFLKSSKSDEGLHKNIQKDVVVLEQEKTVNKEEEVEIIEKRASYNDHHAEILGYMLLILIFVFFTWFGVTFLLKVFNVRTNNVLFDIGSEDLYYCMLLPFILPITFIAVYGNWVAMKFFRHS